MTVSTTDKDEPVSLRPPRSGCQESTAARVHESVYDTGDDYEATVERVNTLNTNARRQGRAERYGIVETRAYKTRDVRTADRWLILVRKADRG